MVFVQSLSWSGTVNGIQSLAQGSSELQTEQLQSRKASLPTFCIPDTPP